MAVGIVEVLIILIVAGVFLLPWLVALVDALRRPDSEWVRADQSKVVWVLVIVLPATIGLGLVGAILYVAMARPPLQRARVGVLPPT